MKVAFIGTRGVPANYGGTETYVDTLSAYLTSVGDEAIVYCKKSDDAQSRELADSQVATGVKRIEMPGTGTKHLDNFLRSFLSTLHACFSDADVVQMNNTGPAFFSLLPRLFGKKTVGAIRAIDSKRSKWNPLAQAFLRLCDYVTVKTPHAVTVNGTYMQDYYRARYGADTLYIPNGVDIPTAGFDRSLLAELGLSNKQYVLFASRLEPEKGAHALLEGFNKLQSEQAPDLHLVFAGYPGKTEGYYQSLLDQQTEFVHFVGHQSGSVLEALYANAFAFVLASTVEGMSNSLLAAMAHGRAVVISDIPENVAVVQGAGFPEDSANCAALMVPAENPAALRQALSQLWCDPQQAKARGAALRQHVKHHYGMRRMLEGTRQLYLKLLAG